MEKSFTLTESLVLSVLQYLDHRPHREVRNIIDGIQQQVARQQEKPDKKLEIVSPEKPK